MFTTLTGFKRNIFGQTGNFQFNANINLDTLFGSANIGFSGAGIDNSILKLEVLCNSGKILDQSGRFLGVYSPNQDFKISGNVSRDRYDLFINGFPVSFGNTKPTGTYNYFYIKPTGGYCQYDFFVNGEKPNLTISSITGGTGDLSATGYITNNSNQPVRIFSGDIINISNNTPFYLSGLYTGDLNKSTSGAFYLVPRGAESFGSYNGKLRLYTNGGIIDYSNLIEFTGTTPPRIPTFNLNGLNIIYNGQNQLYTSNVQYPFSEGFPLNVTLTHVSGSGSYYTDISIISGFSGEITGYIFNTGILTQYLIGSGTGIGGYLSNIGTSGASGYITGDFTYARGTFVWPYTTFVTGFGTAIGYTGIGTGLYNGHVTGTIVGNSGILLYRESIINPIERNADSLFNKNPTGYIHGTGKLYYNSPILYDKLYINTQNAIVWGTHYINILDLYYFLLANTGIYKVIPALPTPEGEIVLSGIFGTESNVALRVDDRNRGTMSFSGQTHIVGGIDLGIGEKALSTVGNVTGFFNNTFTGSGVYTSTGMGNIYGTARVVDYIKEFTGCWNLYTGVSLGQVNFRSFGYFDNDKNKYYNNNPNYFINSVQFCNVSYSNDFDSLRDVAVLTVTGASYPSGLQIFITGNY